MCILRFVDFLPSGEQQSQNNHIIVTYTYLVACVTNHKIVQWQEMEMEMEKVCNVAHLARMYSNAQGPGQLTSTDWALTLTDCFLSLNQSARYFINIFAGIFFIYSELQWFTIRIGRQIESLKCRIKHQLTILERTRTLFQTTQHTWFPTVPQFWSVFYKFLTKIQWRLMLKKNNDVYFSFSLHFFQISKLDYIISEK